MHYMAYAIQAPKYWHNWALFHVYEVKVSVRLYSSVRFVFGVLLRK